MPRPISRVRDDLAAEVSSSSSLELEEYEESENHRLLAGSRKYQSGMVLIYKYEGIFFSPLAAPTSGSSSELEEEDVSPSLLLLLLSLLLPSSSQFSITAQPV